MRKMKPRTLILFVLIMPLPNDTPAWAETSRSGVGVQAGAAAFPITPVDEKGQLWQEAYVDSNRNGRYDAPDPLRKETPFDPFTDTNKNGKWDGPFLAGFKHKEDYYVAKGVHDPLWARALVLKIKETKVALVALDLIGLFYPDVQRIRQDVEDLGFDYVVIASTHTHSGPDSLGLWGPNPFMDGKDPRFMNHIRRQTERAIRKADALRQPVRLTLTETRFPQDFGPMIRDRRDPIVIDDRLTALRITGLSGETMAIVVNGSVHPETLAGGSGLISSDFPHYLREALEKGNYTVHGKKIAGWGGVAIYFSGAVGGLMTFLGSEIRDESGEVLPQGSFEKTRRIGELAAWAVTQALKVAKPKKVSEMRVGSQRLSFPLDNRYFRRMLKEGVLDRSTYTDGKSSGFSGNDIQTEVGLITLFGDQGPVTQWAMIPGEIFPELVHGGILKKSVRCWKITKRKKAMDGVGRERIGAANLSVSAESPLHKHFASPIYFVLGLANDELGYIIPKNDFVFPRYTPMPEFGKDRCGDDDHYEETMSASSSMAPVLTRALIRMLAEMAGHPSN